MMANDRRPDFEWVIQARADIQNDLLTLYKMVEREDQSLTSGDYNDPLKISFSLLVGASFSLWRAAFLSHVRQAWPTPRAFQIEQLFERPPWAYHSVHRDTSSRR